MNNAGGISLILVLVARNTAMPVAALLGSVRLYDEIQFKHYNYKFCSTP